MRTGLRALSGKRKQHEAHDEPAGEIGPRDAVVQAGILPRPVVQRIHGQRIDHEVDRRHPRRRDPGRTGHVPHIRKENHPRACHDQGDAKNVREERVSVMVAAEGQAAGNTDRFGGKSQGRATQQDRPFAGWRQQEREGCGDGQECGRCPASLFRRPAQEEVRDHAAEPEDGIQADQANPHDPRGLHIAG